MAATDRPEHRDGARLGGKLHHVLTICQKMNSQQDLSALLDLIVREATLLLEADRASLFLLDEERGELWSKVALGSDEVLRFDASLGIAGAVCATGRTISVEDAPKDPRFYAGLDARTGYRTRSLLATPVRNFRQETIGVFEALNKPGGFRPEDEEILMALAAQAGIAIETAQLVGELRRHRDQLLHENTRLWQEVEGRSAEQSLIGASERIQAVIRLVKQIRDSAANVLITGESGTGKELVAKAIHYGSARARHPFVALNCAALPETLVESELFGIERGIATGVERRVGKFEAANGGTLFLDEIGDLDLGAQGKLLRVLQERVVERVGGRRPISLDVRVVAATNKDLEAAIGKGLFREDLYYRLKVIHVQMPALREIREDIPLLAGHFLARACRDAKREPMVLAPDALTTLTQDPWPGNARELDNEMRRLVASVPRTTIAERDLSDSLRARAVGRVDAALPGHHLKAEVVALEQRMIREALERCGDNQQRAAIALGLSRQGLIKKMQRYRIGPRRPPPTG